MRFKVGTNVCVKNVYSGGNFENGDIVTITQIGDGDHIRSMGDDELAKFLYSVEFRRSITGGGAMWEDISDCLHWLKSAKSE